MQREHSMWYGDKEVHAEEELRRLIALEEGPPELTPESSAAERQEAAHFAEYQHMPGGDSRRLTMQYGAGATAARAAVLEDEGARPAAAWLAAVDAQVPPFDDTYDIRPSTVMFAASDPHMVPPRSVAAARQLPEYKAAHGWHQAITKEVRRVEGFGAWSLVPMRQYWDELRAFPGRVSIG